MKMRTRLNSRREMPGIHVQWPWSQLIASGRKTIETRGYSLPRRLHDVELAIIETPGPNGKKAGIAVSRIIGTVTFTASKRYVNKREWAEDSGRHLVPMEDKFAFGNRKETWGWIIKRVRILDAPVAAPSVRGIVYARGCKVPN